MAIADSAQPTDRRAVLSAVWTFVLLNYLYGDLAMMMFHAAAYQRVVERMSAGTIFAATVLMELLIGMVLLPRILPYRANRWTNIVMGAIGTVFAAATLVGKPPAFYLFLSAIEIAATVFIVWYAWTWRPPAQSVDTALRTRP